jgi:RNA polymerase sigma-70 factor (ECF subfamily)
MTTSDYNQFVDQYADALYRFVIKNIGDIDVAKDIMQDTFTKFWIKKDNIEKDKVKSYLFSTAYHTLIDYTRKEKRNREYLNAQEKNPVFFNGYSDVNEVLNKALELMPETQKMVLMLRDYEGYSYEEIAEITNLNESQVKVYIFRARKFLKAYIGKMEVLI